MAPWPGRRSDFPPFQGRACPGCAGGVPLHRGRAVQALRRHVRARHQTLPADPQRQVKAPARGAGTHTHGPVPLPLPACVRSQALGVPRERIWVCPSGPPRLAGEHTWEQLVPVPCVRCGLIGHTAWAGASQGRRWGALSRASPRSLPMLRACPQRATSLPTPGLGRVSPAPPLVFRMMRRTVLSAPRPDPTPVVLRQLPPLWAVVTGLSDQLLRVHHLNEGGRSRLGLVPAGPEQTACSVSS